MQVVRTLFLAASLLVAGTSLATQHCDIDLDDDVDRADLALILASRNTVADGPDDPADADADGFITILDARICVLRCTLPGCAEPVPEPNAPPVADAGEDQAVFPGEVVILDGSGSSDPDGDPLTFAWAAVSAPAGSTAVFDMPSPATLRFTADASGTYVFSLTVSDGEAASAPDIVEVSTRSVAYELDLNSRQVQEIGNDGGSVALTDAFGRSFEIAVPAGAVDAETEFALTAVATVAGLPDGLSPVAAIRMEPAGLEFSEPVRLTFGLLPSDRSGPWIAILTDDDGERLLLRTLRGTTPRAAALEDLVVSIDVPHFSAAVIAELENDAGLPPPPPGANAEERAIHIIETRIAELLELIDELGEPASDAISLIDDLVVSMALTDWFTDLQDRLDALAVTPDIDNLDPLADLLDESNVLRLEAGEWLNDDGELLEGLDEAIAEQLAETVASYFVAASERCDTDSAQAQDIFNFLRLDIVDRFTSSDLSDFFAEETFACEYTITLNPVFQAAFVGDTVNIDYTVTRQDGTPLPGGRDAAGTVSGLSLTSMTVVAESADSFTVTSSPSGLLGIAEFEITIGAGPAATAQVLFLPGLVGSYGATGSGTATGCSDEEDEGPGSGGETINFVTQTILSASPNQAVIGIAGVGTIVTGIDLTVTLTAFSPNAATGTVFGGASYSLTEVDDGEVFVTTGSGSLNGSITATPGGSTFTLGFNGGDNFCSSVTGTVTMVSQ